MTDVLDEPLPEEPADPVEEPAPEPDLNDYRWVERDPATGRIVAIYTLDQPGRPVERVTWPQPPHLEDVRDARRVEADAAFASLLAGGCTHQGRRYQVDTAAQLNITAQGALAIAAAEGRAPWPDGFAWIDAENAPVPMDPTQMLEFAGAAAAFVRACRIRYRVLKDAIAAAATIEELEAIEIATGWPT